MTIDTSGMITVAEAAKRLNLSQEQVRRNLRDGKLRGQRVGNQWFIDEHQAGRTQTSYLSPELYERISKRRRRIARRGAVLNVQSLLGELRSEE